MSARMRNVFVFFLLLTVIANIPSNVHAYTFSSHSICRGWTEDRTPILADRYLPGDTVYLYFEIVWVDLSEYETKWREISEFEMGIISASRIVEHYPMKSFSIQLLGPGGQMVNSFNDRKMEKPLFMPESHAPAIASAFLEILNVTSTTESGIWHLKWFDGATLVFDEEFMVGQPATKTTLMTTETTGGPPSVPPTRGFFEGYVLWIIVALGAVAVVVLAFWKTRIAKRPRAPVQPAPEAPGPTAPTQEIVRPAAAKYCIECRELIPEVAVYCPRCASRQE